MYGSLLWEIKFFQIYINLLLIFLKYFYDALCRFLAVSAAIFIVFFL